MNKVNLFVVGAAKAGTTTIVDYLKEYQEIFVPSIKEPNFFGLDFNFQEFAPTYKKRYFFDAQKYFKQDPYPKKHLTFIEERKHYEKLYWKGETANYRVDGSTSYLYSQYAAEEIYKYNPEAKIIISLRNPIDRALSHYLMLLGNGNEKEKNVLTALKRDFFQKKKGFGVSHLYIEMGLYYQQILRYYKLFPSEQILILDFNSLSDDILSFSEEIANFLRLNQMGAHNIKKNQTIVPKYIVLLKLKKLKQYIPAKIIRNLKKTNLYIRNPRQKVFTHEVRLFLERELSEDWLKTKKFLYQKGIWEGEDR